ncbi:MAG: alpha/beta hydrolase [Rhodospirillales bacterium]|nr:alpha/beta hydrolase [Rhodospirillales bacterium]
MNEQRDLPQEAGYNLRQRHPEFEEYFAVWEAESARVRDSLDCKLDVRYGAGPNMTADLFPAAAGGAPIQVFIHGGYWRSMDKDIHSFPAEGFVAAGGAAVSLNYALAPAVTLDTIVEQCRTAIEWIAGNAGRLNGNPDRIFVSGHSAGGHLTGAMLCTDWAARGRPADLVKGGTAISGIFDLAPLMETSINDDVRLDAEAAARNSPIHNLPSGGAGGQLIAAVGAAETPEFLAQNRGFAEAWQARGFQATVMEIEGLHHFNVVMEMGRPGSALTQAALAQMGL